MTLASILRCSGGNDLVDLRLPSPPILIRREIRIDHQPDLFLRSTQCPREPGFDIRNNSSGLTAGDGLAAKPAPDKAEMPPHFSLDL